MIKGIIRADGLAISSLEASTTSGTWVLSSVIRLVDNKTGSTIASTKTNGPWSDGTRIKFEELKSSMEKDAAKNLMKHTEEEADKEGLEMKVDESLGIGEHIGKESI